MDAPQAQKKADKGSSNEQLKNPLGFSPPAPGSLHPLELFKRPTESPEEALGALGVSTPPVLHTDNMSKSTIKSSTAKAIPINQAALSQMRLSEQSEDTGPNYNKRPANVNQKETFISIAFAMMKMRKTMRQYPSRLGLEK